MYEGPEMMGRGSIQKQSIRKNKGMDTDKDIWSITGKENKTLKFNPLTEGFGNS